MATPKRDDQTDLIIKLEKRIGTVEKAITDLLEGGSFSLPNVAAPPAAPSQGGILYVQAGALKYVGQSGTRTTLGAA